MKKLTILPTLIVLTVMFSSPSYAEWTKVSQSVEGRSNYVDFDRIRKHDGYVYFWRLSDWGKLNKKGFRSSIVYQQGDCELFRLKYLSDNYYKGAMGTGEEIGGSNIPDKDWNYPQPNSTAEETLQSVCVH